MMDKLDIIVLGATGFTGKHAVKKLVTMTKNLDKFSWGIAGRSKEKMDNLLLELEELGQEEKTKIPAIICDITKDDIRDVSQRAKLLVNCTGPNTVLSEPIVKACIDTKTHYIDISAEFYHMINLYRTFHKSAEEANVLVIPACGFSAIPAVCGLMLLEKTMKDPLLSAEGYIEIILPKRSYIPGPNKCLLHYGTWESMVYEMQKLQEYRRLKAETYPEQIYEALPDDMKRSFFHRHKGRTWFPYPGPEENVMEMSQRYLYEKKRKKPYHCKFYTTALWFQLLIVVPAMYMYYYLCYFRCFKHLLWKYPRFFSLGYVSHKGPTEQMANDMKYEMKFKGKGSDENSQEKSLQVKISGCDPGYATTATALIVAALTVLSEPTKFPAGGVLPAGAAFEDTQIVENLKKAEGITIEIMQD